MNGSVSAKVSLSVASKLMADGTAAKIADAERIDAAARQKLARQWLGRFGVFGNSHACHCWLSLRDPWRADAYVAAAARDNIAVTPASAFAVAPSHAPNAVRLSMSAPAMEILAAALERLASILGGAAASRMSRVLVRSRPMGQSVE